MMTCMKTAIRAIPPSRGVLSSQDDVPKTHRRIYILVSKITLQSTMTVDTFFLILTECSNIKHRLFANSNTIPVRRLSKKTTTEVETVDRLMPDKASFLLLRDLDNHDLSLKMPQFYKCTAFR